MSLTTRVLGIAISGFIFSSGCGKDITAPIETNNITGRILWDKDDDGVYEPADSTIVILYHKGDSPSRTIDTKTGLGGNFKFAGVSKGDYAIISDKFSGLDYYMIVKYFHAEGQTDVGDIKLLRIGAFSH